MGETIFFVLAWILTYALSLLIAVPLTGVLRYQNHEVGDLARTAEIYDNIPLALHYLMQGEPKFGELVS